MSSPGGVRPPGPAPGPLGGCGAGRLVVLVLDDGLLSPKRLWAVGRAREVAGSVFLDLEVPDCARTPLALSGVALGVTAGTPASGVGELGGVIPFAPTTRRAFARHERVSLFFQVCSGGGRAGQPVTLGVEIQTQAGAPAFAVRETLARELFGAGGIVARRLDLPLADLAAGWYGLVVTATAGTEPPVRLRRELAFVVR